MSDYCEWHAENTLSMTALLSVYEIGIFVALKKIGGIKTMKTALFSLIDGGRFYLFSVPPCKRSDTSVLDWQRYTFSIQTVPFCQMALCFGMPGALFVKKGNIFSTPFFSV